MSSQTLLGVVGAAVGFFVGMPQLGFMVGSLVGLALTPKQRVEGPRVDNLKVSVSTYGGGIPETWGNNVPPTNWIWSTDIIEIGETQSTGKGGGVEQTNYRQFIHGLLAVGKTPAPGTLVAIRKVWKDGKLVYDASSGIDPSAALATAENPFARINLVAGFDDQPVNPIIEGYEGVGNVPAFRGVMSVFVFGLECPGGRIPQLSFEICVGASTAVVTSTYVALPNASPSRSAVVLSGEIWQYSIAGVGYNNPVYAHVDHCTTEGVRYIRTIDMGVWNGDGPSKLGYQPFPLTGTEHPTIAHIYDQSGRTLIDLYQLDTGGTTRIADLPLDSTMPGRAATGRGACDNVTGNYVFASFSALQVSGGAMLIAAGQRHNIAFDYGPALVAFVDKVIYAVTVDVAGRLYLERRDAGGQPSPAMPIVPGPVQPDQMLQSGALCVNAQGVFAYIPRGGSGGPTDASVYLVDIAAGAWVLLSATTGTVPGAISGAIGSYTFYASNDLTVTGPDLAANRYQLTRFKVVVPVAASVPDIIESQVLRAGLTGDQVDLGAINDTVWGYTMVDPASARSNITPLLTACAIAVTEEDGLLRFFRRADRVSVAIIGWDELGVVEEGQDPADPMPLIHGQPAELPRSVTVSYLNPAFDYQVSTESASRQAVDSQLDEQIELAIAMSGDQAATIARRILFERWVMQNARTAKLSRKYAYLSAGDVATFEYPKGTQSNWMITKITDTAALLELECVPADGELLVQTAPGSNGYVAQSLAPLPSTTRLVFGDWPILRDADNDAGLYIPMEGYSAQWRGAELFAGDDVATLGSRGTVANAAIIGVAETALGNWAPNMTDEQNLLTVNIGSGMLSSITSDELLSGTSNVAALGAPGRWEILKFRQADDLGDGRFILSGFVRGARGTERHRGSHALGDTLVLLGVGGTLRPNFDAGAIGQGKVYRAVSLGRSATSAPTETYANTAQGLMPFAPASLSKAIVAGDITLSWVRRTRLSESWLAGIVPLGEASEAYEVVIYADAGFSSVKRVIPTTTRSAVYTSAQQVADFGTNQSTVYVRVYQISDVVGRGNPLEETI